VAAAAAAACGAGNTIPCIRFRMGMGLNRPEVVLDPLIQKNRGAERIEAAQNRGNRRGGGERGGGPAAAMEVRRRGRAHIVKCGCGSSSCGLCLLHTRDKGGSRLSLARTVIAKQ
jgi:hypothetical protein